MIRRGELPAERMSREAVERDERRARRALSRWGNPRAKRQLSPTQYVKYLMARHDAECEPTRIRRPTSIARVRRARRRRRATVGRRAVRSTADPPPPPGLARSSLGRLTNGPGTPGRLTPTEATAGARRGASPRGAVRRPRAPPALGGVDRPGGRGVSHEAPKGPRGEGAEGPPWCGGGRGAGGPLCGPRSGRALGRKRRLASPGEIARVSRLLLRAHFALVSGRTRLGA